MLALCLLALSGVCCSFASACCLLAAYVFSTGLVAVLPLAMIGAQMAANPANREKLLPRLQRMFLWSRVTSRLLGGALVLAAGIWVERVPYGSGATFRLGTWGALAVTGVWLFLANRSFEALRRELATALLGMLSVGVCAAGYASQQLLPCAFGALVGAALGVALLVHLFSKRETVFYATGGGLLVGVLAILAAETRAGMLPIELFMPAALVVLGLQRYRKAFEEKERS